MKELNAGLGKIPTSCIQSAEIMARRKKYYRVGWSKNKTHLQTKILKGWRRAIGGDADRLTVITHEFRDPARRRYTIQIYKTLEDMPEQHVDRYIVFILTDRNTLEFHKELRYFHAPQTEKEEEETFTTRDIFQYRIVDRILALYRDFCRNLGADFVQVYEETPTKDAENTLKTRSKNADKRAESSTEQSERNNNIVLVQSALIETKTRKRAKKRNTTKTDAETTGNAPSKKHD